MLPDLLVKCDVCDGECTVRSAEWQAWDAKWEELREAGVEVGYIISHPEMPTMPDCPEEEPCVECSGSGRLPTSAGQKILELIRWAGEVEDA